MYSNLNIVAIGGGNSKPMLETAAELTGVDNPKVLIIPTARPTELAHEQSIANFGGFFEKTLGLEVNSLHNYYNIPEHDELEERIDEADLVHISGGDTDAMMKIWKLHGIDKLLADKALKGTTLSGISAGAIAPFTWGHSDSLSYKSPEHDQWQFMSVGGIGLLKAGITPHYDSMPEGHTESRATLFHKMFEDEQLNWDTRYGFGIDNNAGIIVHNSKISTMSTDAQNGVTKITVSDDGSIVTDRLSPNETIPVNTLR